MGVSIHPLQEQVIDLLKALYFEKNLGLTKAMHTVVDGYYPSLESILDTLRLYKDEELVSEFVKENSKLIKQAEVDLESKDEPTRETTIGSDAFDNVFGDIFSNTKRVDVFSSIKAVPIADVEKVLSEEIGNLCGEELDVKIKEISNSNVPRSTDVEMKVTVKAKSEFR